MDTLAAEAYERRIQKLEQENKELARKLQGGSIIIKRDDYRVRTTYTLVNQQMELALTE